MARLSLANRFFRWSQATAAQLNNVFDDFVDWTTNSLSVDSLKAQAVGTEHAMEPLTYLLSDHNKHIETVAIGNPLVEVEYTHSPTGAHKILVVGWTWFRRRDGTGFTGSSVNADNSRICYWDTIGAAWNLADYQGFQTGTNGTSHEEARWGMDQIMGSPWPGIGYGTTLQFEYGGGQCVKTHLYKDTGMSDWPEGGKNNTKYGVFGQDITNTRDGQAQIWLFAEDNQK